MQHYEGGGDLVAAWVQRLTDTDAIEADNLKRHENPICTDFHIAIRLHYKHMANGMGGINQAFTSEKKKPALRIANNTAERLKMDSELLYAAKYNRLHNQNKEIAGYFDKE